MACVLSCVVVVVVLLLLLLLLLLFSMTTSVSNLFMWSITFTIKKKVN